MPVLDVQRGRRMKVKWLAGVAEHRIPVVGTAEPWAGRTELGTV